MRIAGLTTAVLLCVGTVVNLKLTDEQRKFVSEQRELVKDQRRLVEEQRRAFAKQRKKSARKKSGKGSTPAPAPWEPLAPTPAPMCCVAGDSTGIE